MDGSLARNCGAPASKYCHQANFIASFLGKTGFFQLFSLFFDFFSKNPQVPENAAVTGSDTGESAGI
jgi:hypothetical protein